MTIETPQHGSSQSIQAKELGQCLNRLPLHPQVKQVPIAALKPYANNPRTHSRSRLRTVVKSIKTFGWTNPILVDEDMGLIAGHGRLEAAKQLGLTEVPVLAFAHMSEAQKRAYVDSVPAEWCRGGAFASDICYLHVGYVFCHPLIFDSGCFGFRAGISTGVLLPFEVGTSGVAHSSVYSAKMAPTRRTMASSLGKISTVLVRRLISLFTRSSGLVEWILRQCFLGSPYRPRPHGERRPWPQPAWAIS